MVGNLSRVNYTGAGAGLQGDMSVPPRTRRAQRWELGEVRVVVNGGSCRCSAAGDGFPPARERRLGCTASSAIGGGVRPLCGDAFRPQFLGGRLCAGTTVGLHGVLCHRRRGAPPVRGRVPPPPISRGQALRGNDGWARGGVLFRDGLGLRRWSGRGRRGWRLPRRIGWPRGGRGTRGT